MLSALLANVLTGMVVIGAGTFFAQAAATGFVGRAAKANRGVASGTNLALLFLRRARRQRSPWPIVRPLRLGRLPCRNRRISGSGRLAGDTAQASTRIEPDWQSAACISLRINVCCATVTFVKGGRLTRGPLPR
jgi:hypothetical protein